MKTSYRNSVFRKACRTALVLCLLSCREADQDMVSESRPPRPEPEDEPVFNAAPVGMSLTFPDASPDVLSTTTSDANTFYAQILANRSYGYCMRFLDGKSRLTVQSFNADQKKYRFLVSTYPTRDCTGPRIDRYSEQNEGLILSFVRSSIPNVWFWGWQNNATALKGGMAIRLNGGKLELMPVTFVNDLKTTPFVPMWTASLLK